MSQHIESMEPTRNGRSSIFLCRLEAVRLREKGWHEPYESRGSCTDLWGTGGETPPVYPARDEGRSLRAALQGEALNRLKLLEVERPQVVSVEEKAYKDTSGMDQEGER